MHSYSQLSVAPSSTGSFGELPRRSPSPRSKGSPQVYTHSPRSLTHARPFLTLPEEVEVQSMKRVYDNSMQSMQELLKGESIARKKSQEVTTIYIEQIEQLKHELQEERQRSVDQSSRIGAYESQLSDMASQLDHLRYELSGRPRPMGVLAASYAPVEPSDDDFTQVALDREEYEHLLDAAGRMEYEESQNQRLARLAEERERAHELQHNAEQAEIARLTASLNAAVADVNTLSSTVDALTQENKLLQSAVAAASTKASVSETEARMVKESVSTSQATAETLRKELVTTQSIAARKVQELSAELANQRSVVAGLKEALHTSQKTLEAEMSIKQLHDLAILRAQLDKQTRAAQDFQNDVSSRMNDKDQLIKTLRSTVQRSNEGYSVLQTKVEMQQRLIEQLQQKLEEASIAAAENNTF